MLEAERPEQAIVFVRTKIRCDQLYRTLRDRGMNVKALHGDMTQGSRDGVMISFKDGRLPLLVATDVAARGLDIAGVSHIINFDVPTSPDVYVHRIGRTGAGRPQRPRDHLLRAPPAARDPGDREARGRQALAVGRGRARRADAGPAAARAGTPSRTSRSTATVPARKLIVSGGRAAGLEPSDIIHAITAATGLDGESVRNVRVLERFAFVEVPESEARAGRRAGQRHRGPGPRAPARADASLSRSRPDRVGSHA